MSDMIGGKSKAGTPARSRLRSLGLIMHKRMLKLHNDSGSLEILDHGSETEAAGAHPLFQGVRRWTTAGLPARPDVKQDGARVTVATPTLNLAFAAADVQWQAESLTIRLH